MRHLRVVFPVLLLLFYACVVLGQIGDRSWEGKYYAAASALRAGDSAAAVGTKLEPPWVGIETNLLLRSAFQELVPYTNLDRVVEWHSREETARGWPLIVFAVFSDWQKTNLIDALLYSGGDGLQPLVEGPYDRNLASIRKGDSMDRVFRLLGTRQCRYFKGPDRRYRVQVIYQRRNGDFVIIEADAGTGVVLEVRKSMIQ